MESIDNDNGAPVLSNGGLLLPAKHIPMPAHDSAIALEKDAELGPKLEEEMDKKIIAKPNEAAREDFLRQSGDELLMDFCRPGEMVQQQSDFLEGCYAVMAANPGRL